MIARTSLVLALLWAPIAAASDNFAADVTSYPSLLAFYKLADTSGSSRCLDSSSNGNHGTASNISYNQAPILALTTPSSAFNGTTSTCILPYTSSGPLAFSLATPFAIEFVDKFGTLGTGAANTIIGKNDVAPNAGAAGWWVGDYTPSSAGQTGIAIQFQTGISGHYWFAETANTWSQGTSHHVGITWEGDGTGNVASLHVYVDGVPQTVNVVSGSSPIGTGDITNGMAPKIGGAVSWYSNSTPDTLSDIAVYNSAHPAGMTPHVLFSGNTPRDALDFFHGQSLAQNNQPPFANPATGCVVFEKDYSDVDVINDINTAVWLMFKHNWTLCAVMVNSAYPPNAASATRALLDAWGLQSVPVYNYQGSGGQTGGPDNGFTNAIETNYRPQDSTDVGIQSFTPSSGGGAGAGYAVGDVFQINGGTLAGGFGAARYVVLTTGTGGSVTSARIKESGSYTVPPSGTVTTAALTGSGTGLTGAITTAAGKGNYGNAEWALFDLINAHPGGVTLINGGQSHLDYAMAQDHLSGLCGLSAVGVMQGWNPNNAMYGAGSEFNSQNTGSEWAAFYSALAACGTPVPVISYGVENTEVNGSGNNQWVYMGENPKSVLNGAVISGSTLTLGSVASGSVAIGDYVYGISVPGGVKIVSGSGLSWQLNRTLGTIPGSGSETMFTNGWDNPAIVAFINNSTATSACQSATPSFYWCRLSWTPLLMYAMQAGINPNGSGRQLWAMWGGNNGTMTMNTPSAGDDSWSPTPQSGFNFITRTASDGVINNQNALVANDNPSNYLPLFRRRSEPGLRAGSRHSN